MHSLTSIIALGLDSFLACAAIGTFSLNGRDRLRLSSAFGAADAIATLLGPQIAHQSGSLLSHRLSGSLEFASIALCSVCLCTLGAFLFPRITRRPRTLIYLAPLVCSLDNLFAGSPPDSALLAGLSSACLALAGLAVGMACHNFFTRFTAEV
jgi:putative Mn2+ efflux pump MntP